MSGRLNHRAGISRAMRGAKKEQVIRKRDAAPKEMAILARVMHDPNPNPKEIHEYIQDLLHKGHVPPQAAYQVLASMPSDPEALRLWARHAFVVVMQQAIHAHAAYPRELYPKQEQEGAEPPAASQQGT